MDISNFRKILFRLKKSLSDRSFHSYLNSPKTEFKDLNDVYTLLTSRYRFKFIKELGLTQYDNDESICSFYLGMVNVMIPQSILRQIENRIKSKFYINNSASISRDINNFLTRFGVANDEREEYYLLVDELIDKSLQENGYRKFNSKIILKGIESKENTIKKRYRRISNRTDTNFYVETMIQLLSTRLLTRLNKNNSLQIAYFTVGGLMTLKIIQDQDNKLSDLVLFLEKLLQAILVAKESMYVFDGLIPRLHKRDFHFALKLYIKNRYKATSNFTFLWHSKSLYKILLKDSNQLQKVGDWYYERIFIEKSSHERSLTSYLEILDVANMSVSSFRKYLGKKFTVRELS